jgi:methyltransferase-like protein 6
LKPGGIVLVRDYGVNDHSMIRFDPGHKLADKFYVRQDGTRTFFFSLEEIDDLFLNCKPIIQLNNEKNSTTTLEIDDNRRESSVSSELFKKVSNEYVFRETVNMKENLRVPRVFIQSKYIRC